MFGIGMQELVIILVIALIFIGPAKLPEVARTLAKGMRELRKASDDLRTTIMVDLDEPPAPPTPRPTLAALNPARPPPAQDADEDVKDAEVVPPIAGSVAVASADGAVSRGGSVKGDAPDPDDATDHRGMPAMPSAQDLHAMIAEARDKLDSKLKTTNPERSADDDEQGKGDGGGRA